ncbi:MAG: choline-sulfatase [Verrucomicrobiales bacterium]|jgi:choline-sulfatase
MKFAAAIFAALLLIPFALLHAQSERPNVLFIAIDDLNDWVGPLGGHPQVQTPHMDRLAARGTTMTNAHCQSPLCNPSRTSLMTGLRPTTTGVYALQPWFRTIPEFEDHVTLSQYFQKHGYRTYYTGKIYHGGYGRGKADSEFMEIGPGASGKPFPPKKLVNTPQPHRLVDWGTFPHKDEDKGDWAVASWAEEKLGTMPDDEPFFMACGFFLPHVPNYATQKWFDLYPKETTELPPIKRDDRADTPRFSWYIHWKLPEPRLKFLEEAGETLNITRSYLATVSFVDSQVGRVLDALEKSGKADNTVVVLWSDHGFHLGEKEITGKNTLWDRSTRVPMIWAGPGVAEGARCNRPAELLDLYPTLAELCGLPKKEGLEGRSLAQQLLDANAPREFPAITCHGPDNNGVRTEKWRYIRYADGSEELYDMEKDPNEWTNLAENPENTAVKADLARWIPADNARPAEGSKSRRIEIIDGKVFWELEEVKPTDPIPEI